MTAKHLCGMLRTNSYVPYSKGVQMTVQADGVGTTGHCPSSLNDHRSQYTPDNNLSTMVPLALQAHQHLLLVIVVVLFVGERYRCPLQNRVGCL